MSKGIQTSETAPIFVNFVENSQFLPSQGKLGMTFAPGKKQSQSMTGCHWDRDLDIDLERLKKEYNTYALISLMRDNEYTSFEIPDIFEKAKLHGIHPVHYPITDGGVPESHEAVLPLLTEICGYINDGKNVVVHCLGGLGRTGLVAACVIIMLLKIDAKTAISLVRKARKGTIQTFRQVTFVEDFAKFLATQNTK